MQTRDPMSATQVAKAKRSIVGELFRAKDKASAIALIRGQITVEEAVQKLR